MRRLVLVEGLPIETVARRFGVHHSTVRRALEGYAAESKRLPSALDLFKPYIVERLAAHPQLTATRLYAELFIRPFS